MKKDKLEELLGRKPKFGDEFKTRDGEKAIFWRKLLSGSYQVITQNSERCGYNTDGTSFEGDFGREIVSLWDE